MLRRMSIGERLTGPVPDRTSDKHAGERAWSLDGGRADERTVDELLRRGLVRYAHFRGGKYEAVLAVAYNPLGRYSGPR